MMKTSVDMKWYVLYTRPRHERAVLSQLEQNNYIAFLPQSESFRKWSDRVKKTQTPLFPNYLFLQNKVVDYSILKMQGVVRYIAHDGKVATISDHDISLIKKSLEYEPSGCNANFVGSGEKVRVIKGSLTGTSGFVLRRHGGNKLYIKIESMSRYLSVSIPIEYVVKAIE